nr:hypothetical protein [Tanacetum cinerariifolium]
NVKGLRFQGHQRHRIPAVADLGLVPNAGQRYQRGALRPRRAVEALRPLRFSQRRPVADALAYWGRLRNGRALGRALHRLRKATCQRQWRKAPAFDARFLFLRSAANQKQVQRLHERHLVVGTNSASEPHHIIRSGEEVVRSNG